MSDAMLESELNDLEESLKLALCEDSINAELSPSEIERQHKFKDVLKSILPYLGSDEKKIIIAEIIIALKLEGFLGQKLSDKDSKLVKVMEEAIMKVPERKKQALRYAYDCLK